MTYDILKGSAATPILIGPVILASDHISAATGITLTVTISKNGAAFAAPTGAVTEIANGFYKIAGNATDSNTAGPVAVHATGAGCDPFDGVMAQVVDPTVAVYGANTVQVGATVQTARDLGASVLLSTGTGAGQLDFTAGVVKANLAQILGTALTETAGQIAAAFKKFFNIAAPASTMDALTLVATVTTYTGNTPQTGDAYLRLGAPAGASHAADVAAVKAVLPAALTGAGNMKADTLAFNGDATAAANIAKTTRAIGRGTASGIPTTTNIPTSAFVPAGAAADQFKGRIITFDADTTTLALRGQSTDITASSNAATPVLTVTALTTAPVAGDTFSVT